MTDRPLVYEGAGPLLIQPEPSLTDPSNTAPANRGQIFVLPAGSGPWTLAKQALRLSAGCWDIRAGIVANGVPIAPGIPMFWPNMMQQAPSSKDPTCPIALVLTLATGGVRWTEGSPLVGRGQHWIRAAEFIEVQVSTIDQPISPGPLVEEVRVMVSAVKVSVPCEPAHFVRTDQYEVAGGAVGQFVVPQGAWRARFYGPNLTQHGTWKFANGTNLHTTDGVTFSIKDQNPPELIVPAQAALFETEVLANGGLFAATWDVQT